MKIKRKQLVFQRNRVKREASVLCCLSLVMPVLAVQWEWVCRIKQLELKTQGLHDMHFLGRDKYFILALVWFKGQSAGQQLKLTLSFSFIQRKYSLCILRLLCNMAQRAVRGDSKELQLKGTYQKTMVDAQTKKLKRLKSEMVKSVLIIITKKFFMIANCKIGRLLRAQAFE